MKSEDLYVQNYFNFTMILHTKANKHYPIFPADLAFYQEEKQEQHHT